MSQLMTRTGQWLKARATNADDNGFPSRPDMLTLPGYTGATAAQATNYALKILGDIAKGGVGGKPGNNLLKIKPYAIGADTNTFSFRVYGVSRIYDPASEDITQWTWTLLAQFACTCSTPVGLSGGLVLNTERYVDTITLTYPTAAIPSIEINTNAADLAGMVKVDLSGFEAYELTFTTGGSATSCNALVNEY